MGFAEAIRSGFANYATFAGRASRPAYRWWALFGVLVSLVTRVLDGLLGSSIVRTTQYGARSRSASSPASPAWRCSCPRSPSWCAGCTTPTARGGGTGSSSSPSSAGSCCSISWSAPAPRAPTGTARRRGVIGTPGRVLAGGARRLGARSLNPPPAPPAPPPRSAARSGLPVPYTGMNGVAATDVFFPSAATAEPASPTTRHRSASREGDDGRRAPFLLTVAGIIPIVRGGRAVRAEDRVYGCCPLRPLDVRLGRREFTPDTPRRTEQWLPGDDGAQRRSDWSQEPAQEATQEAALRSRAGGHDLRRGGLRHYPEQQLSAEGGVPLPFRPSMPPQRDLRSALHRHGRVHRHLRHRMQQPHHGEPATLSARESAGHVRHPPGV